MKGNSFYLRFMSQLFLNHRVTIRRLNQPSRIDMYVYYFVDDDSTADDEQETSKESRGKRTGKRKLNVIRQFSFPSFLLRT